MIRIKKRNGNLEHLDISKIQKQTADATKDLDFVSQSELELDSHIQFRDGMSSEEIQNTLIQTAVQKIDIDRPQWTFVGARLFLYDLYHKVGKLLEGTKGNPYCHLTKYIKYGESVGRIIPGLDKMYDMERLNSAIVPERDFLFNYLGIKTLFDRYLLKNEKKECFELPQQMFMGIAMFLAQNEGNGDIQARTDKAIEFYDVVSKFEVMLATPTLSNARTNRHQMSSCFIGATPDNIEGIFDGYKEMALLSKFGGGIGWDWNSVRGIASFIDGHKGAAGGTVPFLKITNDIAIAVDQLGCVAENTYVEVLDKVITNNGEHDFRKEYVRIDISEKEKIEEIAGYASNFAFEYGKYNKNFISSLIYDYIVEKNPKLICSVYGLNMDTYKKIIGKYKKINKGLPEGFVILKNIYAINKEGIVINLDSLKPLKHIIDRKGYVRVSLNKKSYTLHTLLIKTFYGNYEGTVDHKDNNKLNNSLDNLRVISNEKNVSKSWLEDSSLRKEKIRIKGFLSYGKKLNGKRTEKENKTIINEIKTKKILIGDLRVGDLIKSYSLEKDEVQFKEVLSTYNIEVKQKDQIKLIYKDGSYIVTSKWHPTLISKNNKPLKYYRADEANVGDLGLSSLGKVQEIIEIDNNPCYPENYKDITVKDNNNYFASTDNKEGSFHLIHNTRKGAIAVFLEPWHKDIVDFLDIKKNSGEERRRTHDLFPALWIPDLFMRRVAENKTMSLFSPDDVPELEGLYGEAFDKRYEEYERDASVPRDEISAKELWKRALTSYNEVGSPFLCWKDTANRTNPNSHVGTIRSSNLCVTGDTRLATQFGLVTAKELYEQGKDLITSYDLRVNGDRSKTGVAFAKSLKMHLTKKDAEVFKVTTKDGYEIKSTLWHEYYVVRDDKVVKLKLEDIKVGDKLLIQSDVGQFGRKNNPELAFTLGSVVVCSGVPELIYKGDKETVKAYLKGLFSAHSEILIDEISIYGVNEFLKEIQVLLSNFGIRASVMDNKLSITKANLVKFAKEIELEKDMHKVLFENIVLNQKREKFEVEIVKIERHGIEDVYDTTQELNHSLIFNGLVTGNCTEIFQNTKPNEYKVKIKFEDDSTLILGENDIIKVDSGLMKLGKKVSSLDSIDGKKVYIIEKEKIDGETAVCNLASVNLSKINTKEDFERVVKTGVRMLDNVIDLNFYPVEKTKRTNMKSRAIGFGVMGEAQMLAEKGIVWGSEEHFKCVDEIMEIFSYNVINSSADLARERGSYNTFEGSKWQQGIFPIDIANENAKKLVQRDNIYNWEALREKVKGGIRNGYLMAIAPTSSISILVGTTQAIEPVYRRKWFEENLSGLIPVVAPNLSPETWNCYVPAFEVDQINVIKAAAIRQKWIDQGQSTNIFLSSDIITGKLLHQIYVSAWKYGCKSTYYLRSESPDAKKAEMSVADRSIECEGCQ